MAVVRRRICPGGLFLAVLMVLRPRGLRVHEHQRKQNARNSYRFTRKTDGAGGKIRSVLQCAVEV